ncbi:hypothetical protein KEM55_004468 [Ascosphaera atra]|nr:hypothetical protein KEM55_004468 [Ascosphaera atra]
MFGFILPLAALALTASLPTASAQGVGTLIVQNDCPHNITVKHVDSPNLASQIVTENDVNVTQPFRFATLPFQTSAVSNTGRSVMIAREMEQDVRILQPSHMHPFLAFQYTLEGHGASGLKNISYTLKNKNGKPFDGETITLEAIGGACQAVKWPKGVPTSGKDTSDSCTKPVPIGSFIVQNNCREKVYAWHAPPGKNISIPASIDPFYYTKFQYQAIHNQVFEVLVSPDPYAVNKDANNQIPGSNQENAGVNNGDNEPGLAGQFTIFTYGWDPANGIDKMTYTLDNCNGNPFVGHEVLLQSGSEECPRIDWPAGVPTAAGGGQMWYNCTMSTWLTLTVCAEAQ